MDHKEFQLRREKLFSKMIEQSFFIAFSGHPIKSSQDATYPFYVNQNFYYLTGIEQENCVLIMLKTETMVATYLFIDAIDETRTRWDGKKLDLETAKQVSGIQDVLLKSMYQVRLDEILAEKQTFGKVHTLYLDLEKDLVVDKNLKTTHHIKDTLIAHHPTLLVLDLYPSIVQLRMIKSPAEIDAIRRSIQGTAAGIQALMRYIKPGLHEYNLEALFLYAIKDYGNLSLSFPSIIASGKNAVILHYPNPKDKISDGVLVLCDVGASYNHYRGDITRTIPSNRQFNPLQKQIYRIVLEANNMVIKLAKPGLSILDLQAATIKFLAEACVKEGLIKSIDEIGQVYYHNVSHHLGLDTHDPISRDIPLQPGCVITVEPGLYFKDLGIGVRIEDDILITEHGAENLSQDIPKTIEALEKLIV